MTIKSATVFFTVIFGLLCFVRCAHFQNKTRTGKCTLEVPTVDLISEEDRSGVIPQGNGSRPGYSKIEVCCSGYHPVPHTHLRCEPTCDNGCDNGNCTAPNVCVCKHGYVKDYDQKCVPSCPIGCSNGVCNNNNRCSCNPGYDLDQSGKFCIPRCSGGCGVGGKCVAPDTCECQNGFYKNRGKCEYYCEGGCQGGTCIGPNQCSCKQGYTKEKNSCVPDCPRGCRNGICTAPNRCVCREGWTLNPSGTVCEAHCSEPCLNGECSGPNVCTCKKGYIKDATSVTGNRCVAHCPDGCDNGQCSAPNFCICNPGFVKESKGSNKCIRRTRRAVPRMHFELIPEQYKD